MVNAYLLLIFAITLFAPSFVSGRKPSPSCSLQLNRGPCNNYTAKWYYDSYSKQCRSFYYGGCQGNANRFNSLEECKATCDREEDNPAVKRCFKPFDRGTCNGHVNKWYYDGKSQDCVCGTWGGCGGNDNLFKSYQECSNSCGQFIPKTGKFPKTNNDCPIYNMQTNNKSLSYKNNINWMRLQQRPRPQYFNNRKLNEAYYNINASNRYAPRMMQRPSTQQRRLPIATRIQQNIYPKQPLNPYQTKLTNSNKNRPFVAPPSTNKKSVRTGAQFPNPPSYQRTQSLPTYLTNYPQPGHPAPKYPPHGASIHISPNHPIKNAPNSQKYMNQWPWRNGNYKIPSAPSLDSRHNAGVNLNSHSPSNYPIKPSINRTLPAPTRDESAKGYNNYLPQPQKFRVPQKPTNQSMLPPHYSVNQKKLPSNALPKASEPVRPTVQLDPTYAPIYPTYPPSHLYIPQEPYSAPLSPFAKQLPKYPPAPSQLQIPRKYNETENLSSLKQSYPEQDQTKEQKLTEQEKKERDQRKKLKKDALFAKLKQQEMERWYQMRRNYLRNGKPIPQNPWTKPTTPTHYENPIAKATSESGGMGGSVQPIPTAMAPTITNADVLLDTNLQHPNTIVDGNEAKSNSRNDDSFSEEYDEGTETYDDPLQFFMRMKQPSKSGTQEVDTTESDGYAYADEETGS
uniref:BPTI/Kunitz inhibitor domain-containing protein n=1 Tax=Syphacia muris TaxID=451379 RepID=A0A0N5AZ91_9BILA